MDSSKYEIVRTLQISVNLLDVIDLIFPFRGQTLIGKRFFLPWYQSEWVRIEKDNNFHTF